jgi:predicted ATPase
MSFWTPFWGCANVQPEVLKSQILSLRGALGDNARNPIYIETIPRRGYRFIGPPATASVRNDQRTSALFVGRRRIMDSFLNALACARRGDSSLIFITGDKGMGKSALLDQFEILAQTQDAPWRIGRGQCVEGFAGREPYYAVLQAVGDLCRSCKRGAIATALRTYAPTWLAQLPDLRTDREEGRFESAAAPGRMLREILCFLAEVSQEGPILILLEDLQWADAASIDFIDAFARQRGESRSSLVATTRPTTAETDSRALMALKRELYTEQLCTSFALAPLDLADIRQLLTPWALPDTAAAQLARMLHTQTDGIPHLVQMATTVLVAEGVLAQSEGCRRVAPTMDALTRTVGASLTDMIEAQIQQCPQVEQDILEAASVVGEAFDAASVAAVIKADLPTVEADLDRLARGERYIVRGEAQRRGDGGVSQGYRFRHGVFRRRFFDRQGAGRREAFLARLTAWSGSPSRADLGGPPLERRPVYEPPSYERPLQGVA